MSDADDLAGALDVLNNLCIAQTEYVERMATGMTYAAQKATQLKSILDPLQAILDKTPYSLEELDKQISDLQTLWGENPTSASDFFSKDLSSQPTGASSPDDQAYQTKVTGLTDTAIQMLQKISPNDAAALQRLANDPAFGGYLDQITQIVLAMSDPANKNNPFAISQADAAQQNLEALLRKADPFFNVNTFTQLIQKAMTASIQQVQQTSSSTPQAIAPSSSGGSPGLVGGFTFRIGLKNGKPVVDILNDAGPVSADPHSSLAGHDLGALTSNGTISGAW